LAWARLGDAETALDSANELLPAAAPGVVELDAPPNILAPVALVFSEG
jgi:hypothetical protein